MRKRQRDDSPPAASWLTTYSDMMSLLLAFFVLLFTFSSLDVEKFSSVMAAFQQYVGIFSGRETPPLTFLT